MRYIAVKKHGNVIIIAKELTYKEDKYDGYKIIYINKKFFNMLPSFIMSNVSYEKKTIHDFTRDIMGEMKILNKKEAKKIELLLKLGGDISDN